MQTARVQKEYSDPHELEAAKIRVGGAKKKLAEEEAIQRRYPEKYHLEIPHE